MAGQRKWGNLLSTFAFLTALGLANCTTKKGTEVDIQAAPTVDGSQYDPSTSINANTSNGNLFDTAVTGDVPPTTGTSTTLNPTSWASLNPPPYTTNSQYCLNGSYPVFPTSQPPPSGAGTSYFPTSCLGPNPTQPPPPQTYYNWTAQSFDAMQACYDTVMASSQNYLAQGIDAETLFQSTSMALVRCFRDILNQQMTIMPWSPDQVQSYQYNDASMYYILVSFAQQQPSQ